MAIQYNFFIIPIKDLAAAQEPFNRFLRTVRTLSISREFVEKGENSFWAIAVEYLITNDSRDANRAKSASTKKIDYRELLSPEDFALYAKLREWRKASGEKESVPLYTIFTNDQLAQIAQQKIHSLAELGALTGIGEARVKRYGNDVLAIIQKEIA